MKSLIDKINDQYNFQEINPTVLKGYSRSMTLRKFEQVFNEGDTYVVKVRLSEMHENNESIENMFRVTVFDGEDEDCEGVELFAFTNEERLFKFLEVI